jgi:cytochrome P450
MSERREARMPHPPAPDWDPRDPVHLSDPRRTFDGLRQRCPVAWSDFLGWSLFRHDDVTRVLDDPATFGSDGQSAGSPDGLDPPAHDRYRAAIAPYFTPEALAGFAPACRQLARDQIQTLLTRRETDVVVRYIEPFVMKSLCRFLGWETGSWEPVLGWTHRTQQAAFRRDRAAGDIPGSAFAAFVAGHLDAARSSRAGDASVTARLLATQVDDRRLSDDEIVDILLTWTAGQGSTVGALGIILLHLAETPDLQQRLRADPGLIPNAIEEFLRLDGPLVSSQRTATRDVEIEGRQIAAGASLSLMWIAADRDPATFDHSEEFRLDRDTSASLVFGDGIHACLGADLARLELRIGLEELLAATATIERVETRTAPREVYPSNGIESLVLRLA